MHYQPIEKDHIPITAWKVSKYGDFPGLYFPVFSPNAGKHGPEKSPYLDTFHAVNAIGISLTLIKNSKGPIIGPCGTPHIMLETSENSPNFHRKFLIW